MFLQRIFKSDDFDIMSFLQKIRVFELTFKGLIFLFLKQKSLIQDSRCMSNLSYSIRQ